MKNEGLNEDLIMDGDNVFQIARQLSLHVLGASNDLFIALIFRRRVTEIGYDQLISTDDSFSFVVVYTARTGACQRAFRTQLLQECRRKVLALSSV